MKKFLLIGIPLLILMLALVLLSTGDLEQPPSQANDFLRETSKPPVWNDDLTSRSPEKTRVEEGAVGTVRERIEFALQNPHSSSERYRILMELLATDEEETLRILGERRYPADLPVDSPMSEEIAMITRAALEFYGAKPLAETLDKLKVLRPTNQLHTSVVGDLFFATEGAENTGTLYDWIMEHPDDPASQISGAAVGGKLMDFAPEVAWEKTVALPEGSVRSGAFTSVVSAIAADDVNQAIEYINSVEVTQDLDQAISNLVGQTVSEGYVFEDLVQLAAAQVDPNYRSSSLHSLFYNWAGQDVEALKAWVQQDHGLPADQLAEIQLMVKQAIQRHAIDLPSSP